MRKRIAFAGTRGLPASYGGFETAVDEITRRFVRAGYDCHVFCRRSHSRRMPAEDNGRRLIYVRGATSPRLETVMSAIQTGWYLVRHRREYDHVFWFNNANLPGILLTRLAGLSITVNTDGLEWRRRKWAAPFKAYYFLASWLISRVVPRLIADSTGIRDYYRKVFRRRTYLIPYGIPDPVHVPAARQAEILGRFDLEPGGYFLQITRIEPDNLPLEAARGFAGSGLAGRGFKFVVVGWREETAYALLLKNESERNPGIRVQPAVYDPAVLFTLRSNCFGYVHGNSVGGTNPALLEAMADCPRILASDVIFNREVLAGAGLYFEENSLAAVFRAAGVQPEQRDVFKKRVLWYNWEAVAGAYRNIVEGKPCEYAGAGDTGGTQ